MSFSPYENIPPEEWEEVTRDLIRRHPLTPQIVDFCLKSWQSLLHGRINTYLNINLGGF